MGWLWQSGILSLAAIDCYYQFVHVSHYIGSLYGKTTITGDLAHYTRLLCSKGNPKRNINRIVINIFYSTEKRGPSTAKTPDMQI